MKATYQIAEDLFFIEQPYTDIFTGILVIVGEQSVGLIDTGLENSPSNYIFPLLYELGHDPRDIKNVVNTHGDGDHADGNVAIKRLTQAKIAIHKLDPKADLFADTKLEEGDIVQLGNRNFKVIHTPGHTIGSICLYDEKNLTLVTGDSVWGTGLTFRKVVLRNTIQEYIRSLNKLKKINVRLLIMGHPFKPFEKAVLSGSEAQIMILESIKAVD